MMGASLQGNVMRLARVAEVHQEHHAVDLVFLDDFSQVAGVQVMTPYASTNHGTVNLPQVTVKEDKWSVEQSDDPNDTEMLAVVAMIGTRPIVMGFLYPQIGQMNFEQSKYPNMMIERHLSGFLRITTNTGGTIFRHPSGSIIAIGGASVPENDDIDENFNLERTSAVPITITVPVGGGGQTAASIVLEPDGTIEIYALKSISIIADESILMKAPRIDINP